MPLETKKRLWIQFLMSFDWPAEFSCSFSCKLVTICTRTFNSMLKKILGCLKKEKESQYEYSVVNIICLKRLFVLYVVLIGECVLSKRNLLNLHFQELNDWSFFFIKYNVVIGNNTLFLKIKIK